MQLNWADARSIERISCFRDNCQMSSDFANFWQKHTRGNLQHDSDSVLVKKLVLFLSVEDQLKSCSVTTTIRCKHGY